MPAPTTIHDFLDVCRKSGVVEESSLSSISGPGTSTPVAAAKALIKSGALTKFQAGQLLAGKYKGLRFDRLKILDRIGQGGMGTVFLCEHLGLRKRVAVKVLPPDQAGDEGVRERFAREARAAAALDHPNIVRVHDMNTAGGVHYIVMEYVEGQDLQTMLNKYGPVPYTRACTYVAQAALGLQHAFEKGLIHRDIKPQNLMVDAEGVIKILDLGLARFNQDTNDKLTEKYDKGAVLGTADYMAPEQIFASSAVDIRADIYSLGVTLYTLINGKPPFGGSCTQKLMGHQIQKATSLTEIRREVPKGLSAVVEKMMAKKPEDRHQTPAEVVEAMNPWAEVDTIPLDAQQTRRMSGSGLTRRRRVRAADARSRMPLVVAAVALSAVVFGGVGVWALTGRDKGEKAAAATDNLAPPAGTPVVVANTASPTGTPTTGTAAPLPAATDTPRLTYEIDFAKAPRFFAQFDNKERITFDGVYPPGWTAQSWRAGAAAEVAVRDYAGSRGVMIRTNRGDGGSAELHTAFGAGPFRLTPGRQYLLRTEYINVGMHPGTFEVRFDAERPPVRNAVQLQPTGGQWRTAELRLTAPAHERSTTYFTYNRSLAPDFLVVRSVQVSEYATDAPPQTQTVRPQVVWESDFAKVPPFRGTMAKPGGLKMDEGRLPDGWSAYVWKQGSAGDVAFEEFAGKTGIAFRTTSGDASAEITTHGKTPRDLLKAGRRYRVDVEYAAPGGPGGRLDVRLDDPAKPGTLQVRLAQTGESWRTEGLEVRVPDDKDRPLSAYVSNFGVGQENTLYVKSLTVSELVDGATSSALNDRSIYRFSADEGRPVRIPTSKGRLVTPADAHGLPANLAADSWRDGNTGEVAIEDISGRRALTLRNASDSNSVQVRTNEPVGQLRAGQEYVVHVSYWADSSVTGQIEPRKAHAGSIPRLAVFKVSGTGGEWREDTFSFTPTEDCPLYVFVQNTARGPDARLAIDRIDVSRPGSDSSAAEGPPGAYRLTLTGARAFARRYKADAVLESQGDGSLPAPWAAHTLSADTLGDVFIDPVGSHPAIGLRNHQGPPSVRLFTRSGLLQARAGKKYAVKVTYQTEANGKGGFRIAVGRVEAGRSDFTPSTGTWTDAEVTVTAATDGPLMMTVECGSVGSEASIYIREIDVREQP